MAQIKITWQAFGNKPERNREITSVEFELPISDMLDIPVMDMIYTATNLQDDLVTFGYTGGHLHIWNTIKPLLAPNRTHTSLSVGDAIKIDNRLYLITDAGFKLIMETALPTTKVGA